MIWTRNNFFLLTEAGLLAFTLNQNNSAGTKVGAMGCIAGLLLSVVWLWITLAGKRFILQWRKIISEVEKEVFNDPQIKGPFQMANESGEDKDFIVNVTLALTLLSGGFVVVWVVLLFLRVYQF